jgi:hypothetical protein
MCRFRRFPAIGLLLSLFLDCFVCFGAVTVTGKNESGAFFPYFLRVRELFLSGAFQIVAKWRLCVVIGKNTPPQAEQRGKMTVHAACPPTRHCEPAKWSNPVYPHGLLHPAGSQ